MLPPRLILPLATFAVVVLGAPTESSHKGHFHVDQVRNTNARRNGPAEYAHAHAKYGLPVPDALARLLHHSKAGMAQDGGSGEIPAWAQEHDLEYLSPVFVGEPPQMVFLNFDTGSADTWMYSSETREGHRNGQRYYTPKDSKFAKSIDNATWSIQYGDGSYASGTAYRDVMALGDVRIPDMTIQTALSVSSMMTEDLNMSGLAGLCANHPSTVRPSQPSLLDLLEPILDEYVFTADLRYHAEGRYRFGKIVKEDYIGDLVYVPTNQSSMYWELSLNGIHVSNTNRWFLYEWPMIADTGTTLMLLPPELASMYWQEVPGAEYNPFYDSWTFPCARSDQLPDWEFQIGGFRSAVPGRYMNYMPMSNDPATCYGGLQPFPAEIGFGILGDVFLKAVFAAFDVKNKTIGFAKKELWA